MKRFGKLPDSEKAKVLFIHLNHTNHAIWPDGDARRTIEKNGFKVAGEGEKVYL